VNVQTIAREITGASFVTEGTGGNCEALVARLEGGMTLVLCSNLSVPQWGDRDTSVALYTPGSWDDGGQDALRDEWTDAPLDADVLRQMIATVLT
jgi:hypothetical protein